MMATTEEQQKVHETTNPDRKDQAPDKPTDWYQPEIGSALSQEARELLEEYSHVPPDEVESHILSVRERGWAIHPYPCLGRFFFIQLNLSLLPYYPTLLRRLLTTKPTLIFLDLGCGLGQDIRKLLRDGVPASSIHGVDLRQEFIDLGYELFRDKETLSARLIAGDFLDPKSPISELNGKVDVIYLGAVLHLFGWAGQVETAKRIVSLLRPKPGSLIIGRHVGSLNAGEVPHSTNLGGKMYQHNRESFERLWAEVGKATGSKWVCREVELDIAEGLGQVECPFGVDSRRIRFVVERVDREKAGVFGSCGLGGRCTVM